MVARPRTRSTVPAPSPRAAARHAGASRRSRRARNFDAVHPGSLLRALTHARCALLPFVADCEPLGRSRSGTSPAVPSPIPTSASMQIMLRADPTLFGTVHEPLWSLLYRYWFWGWLFRDVNEG